MSYHPVYPSWDGPFVVCNLFLYLSISAPTTAFTWLSTFCTLHLSSTFYLSHDTSWVQGFIFEGDLQFSKLFKMTICEGMCSVLCTLKCTEKCVILFTPSICSISLSPIQNLKEALPLTCRMYSIVHLSKIIRLSASSPVYSIHPLRVGALCGFTVMGHCKCYAINFTITYKVAVYAPAERADTLILFHLYPYVLCAKTLAKPCANA
jgi:hypothetical protein